MSELTFIDILKKRNEHPRDKNLKFEAKWHNYTVVGDTYSKYTSVTKLVKGQFPIFDADLVIKRMMSGKNWNEDNKYWGMTPPEIKKLWTSNGAKQSSAGTNLHFNIEQFMNQWLVDENDLFCDSTHDDLLDSYKEDVANNESNISNTSKEWNYFINFISDHLEMKPFRTEWMIYDEDLKLAGSIDMLYKNSDGTYDIYDWKRCKEITKVHNYNTTGSTPFTMSIPDTNFWHYSLQLNTYKAILLRKYGINIRNLYLVQFHIDNPKDNYEIFQCADLQEEVGNIFDNILRNKKH